MRSRLGIFLAAICLAVSTVAQAGERIFALMLATASGRATKSELHGYGQNEFVPWQLGAVM